jgi:catechol 2,3-dioxygenase-like lactoylglutathione lyase family enzyme
MFDHVSITVNDLARAIRFYRSALEPLGLVLTSGSAEDGFAGFGAPGGATLWLAPGEPSQRVHLAFTASSRAAVDGFYLAALAAGGRDNGKPGIRASYDAGYYAAFVLDPDGGNVEAVLHE